MRVRVEGWPKIRPSVRPGQARRAVDLEHLGEVEDRLGLGGHEVADPEQVATRERDRQRRLHSHRSFAAATAAPTSPSRGRRPARAARTCPPEPAAATCSWASRNGTPCRDERLGRVGRAQQRVGAGRGEPLAVEARARATSTVSASSAPCRSARAAKTGGLVLLEVAVVGERQALHGREQAGEPADRGAGLAARELGDVGVQLLRHHRRAGRRVLGQAGEAELGRRPEHELLADPREVGEEHRAGVEVVEREVAVGDGVDRVPHRVGRRRQRQRRAGERARPERRRRRPGAAAKRRRVAVALEHLGPGEQVVAERHRDRALQVRVPGHRRLGLLGRAVEHRRGRTRAAPPRPRRRRRAT